MTALVRPPEVAAVAAALSAAGPVAQGDAVASWIRWLHYIPDPPWIDAWQSPLETLARGGGDCEDLAILALSLLLSMGGRGLLVAGLHASPRGVIGHAWVEGWDRAGWLHLDATTGVVSRFARPPAYLACAVYPAR